MARCAEDRGQGAGGQRLGAGLSLLAVALGSLGLYWLLWTPAYRLNERFEYADLLLGAFPPLGPVLAAQLGLLRALVPPAVASYEGTRVLFAVLLAALFGLYGLALWLVARVSRRAVMVAVLGTTLAFQLVLLLLPGTFSTDLFSYAFYGEVAGRFAASPYVQVPDDFPAHPLYLLINPLWRDAPSVYGPVWIAISSIVGALWGGDVLAQVLAYHLIADGCHWANLAALWWALRRLRPGAEPFGLALYAWNPLVVFEFAANGHNDGLLVLFLLLAMGLVARGRDWRAVAALVLSVATKYTTVLLLPLLVWWATRRWRGWRRLAAAAGAGLAAGGAVAAMYLPWWRGPATFGPIIYWLSTPLYANYAPLGIAAWVRDRVWAAGWLDWDTAEQGAFAVERQFVRLGFLGYLAIETLRLRRAADLPLACARVLLVFLIGVNTWVLPWYYTAAVALVALGDPRSRTTWLTLGLSATAPLAMYWAQTHLEGMDSGGYVLYLAPLGVLVAWEAWRQVRAGGAAAPYGALRTLSSGGRKTSCAPGSTLKK
jgi:alpha-1,6-mannosyltransferase